MLKKQCKKIKNAIFALLLLQKPSILACAPSATYFDATNDSMLKERLRMSIEKVRQYELFVDSAGAYSEVNHSKLKYKAKMYLGDERICSCCMAKLYIHYNFLTVLNENGYANVDDVNDEINGLKNEYREL